MQRPINTVVRYAERPELWGATDAITEEVWPEYNRHGDVVGSYWDRLFDDFPGFQFAICDAGGDEVLAEGHAAPCVWDGTVDRLPDGIDAAIAGAFAAHVAGETPTALCALAAEVRPRFRRQGLSRRIIEAMIELAREAALTRLIAPVRPSLKELYPITPIERYVTWTGSDGEPFDPWIRAHTRCGGEIVRAAPRSMRITGTVAEWEAWTGIRLPEDGEYTFPGGLAPLEVDRRSDLASYWEPNIWVVHTIR